MADGVIEQDSDELPIEFFIDHEMRLTFADVAFVQHTDEEFVLSFFQTNAPFAISQEETKALTKVRANCVVRIVLTPQTMVRLYNALGGNLRKFQERIQQKTKEQRAKEQQASEEGQS